MTYTINDARIYVRNIRVHAYHGVLPQERIVGNDYLVNLEIVYPLQKSLSSDDLNDTLNYAKVATAVTEVMSKPYNLIERAAGAIGEALFEKFAGITEIEIDIEKIKPPMSIDCDGAGIKVHLTRQ